MLADIEAVLQALEGAGVRYLVVGGIAVVLHGRLRTTVDLDLAIDLDPANVQRAADALESLGYSPRSPVRLHDLGDPDVRRRWVQEKNALVLSLWSPRAPMLDVDVFVEMPFSFDEVWSRRVVVDLEHTQASVVSLADLRAMKRRAGRARDLDDLEALPEPE